MAKIMIVFFISRYGKIQIEVCPYKAYNVTDWITHIVTFEINILMPF